MPLVDKFGQPVASLFITSRMRTLSMSSANHLMAHGLAPSSEYLHLCVYQCYNLLSVCSEFGIEHDIKYNSTKIKVTS